MPSCQPIETVRGLTALVGAPIGGGVPLFVKIVPIKALDVDGIYSGVGVGTLTLPVLVGSMPIRIPTAEDTATDTQKPQTYRPPLPPKADSRVRPQFA